MNRKYKKGELEAVALLTLVRSGEWMTVEEICDAAGVPLRDMSRTMKKAGERPVFRAGPDMACAGLYINSCSRFDELGISVRERKGEEELEYRYQRRQWAI